MKQHPQATFPIGETNGLPDLPAFATRHRSGLWAIETAVPCPYCNKPKHTHGGGDANEPFLGNRHWVAHCASDHRPFRPDCRASRSPGGRLVCARSHARDRGYYLHLVDRPA